MISKWKVGNPTFGHWNPENMDKPYRSGTHHAKLREAHRCQSCKKLFLSIYSLKDCYDHEDLEAV